LLSAERGLQQNVEMALSTTDGPVEISSNLNSIWCSVTLYSAAIYLYI
jgi:hypothetical protein